MQREDWVVLLGSALSGGQVGTSVCIPDVCYPEVGERGGGLIIKVGLGYCWTQKKSRSSFLNISLSFCLYQAV